MPPKKKPGNAKGKGKKKKGKKKDGVDELTVDDLYKRTVQEVDTLKERLGLEIIRGGSTVLHNGTIKSIQELSDAAERQAYARRSRASEEIMKERMVEAKTIMHEEKLSKREITFDLTRQYKTMQTQLEGKVEYLEAQVRRLQKALDLTTLQLHTVTEERDNIKEQRDQEVTSLHGKLQDMEKSFESILQDAFDALAVKMDTARQKWDGDSQMIESGAIQILSEFGKDLRSYL